MPKEKAKRWGWLRKFFTNDPEPEPIPEPDGPEEPLPTEDMGLIVLKSSSSEYNGLTPDYYISTTGSDSNDGLTPATAWAITALGYKNYSHGAGAGDTGKQGTYDGKTIGFVDGTYNLYDIVGRYSEQGQSGAARNTLRVAGGTDNNNRTILVSQTPRGAIIDGQRAAFFTDFPTATYWYGLIGAIGDYVTFDGFKFQGAHNRISTNYTDASFVTWKNCHFTDQSFTNAPSAGNNSCMLYFQSETDILITNCRFTGGSAPDDSDRHAQIETYNPTARFTVEYCTFTAEAGTGNTINHKSSNNSEITHRYNFFSRTGSTTSQESATIRYDGAGVVSTDTFTMHNCILVAAGGHDNLMNNPTGYPGTYDLYNNDWVGDYSTAGNIIAMNNSTPGMNFYNNIVWQTAGSGTDGDLYTPALADVGTLDYNSYPSSPLFKAVGESDETTLGGWQTLTSKEANSRAGDPQFVESGSEANFYKLDTGSPCLTLGAGSTEVGAWAGQTQIGCDFT